MNNLFKLCNQIEIPTEVVERLQQTELPFDENQLQSYVCRLTDKNQYATAWQSLKEFDGFVQLKTMLTACLQTEKIYQQLGIDHGIFVDTMKCFSRFLNESKENLGNYLFDRGFWVGRQLSCLLFRLGELEYELASLKEQKAISLHIPSNCDMTPSKLDASILQAKDFFAKFFPDYANAPYFCYSWLVAPNLKHLLAPTSKIIQFQQRFEIIEVYEQSNGYVQWVFKKKDIPLADYPEDTSLQRNMKRYLLDGGLIGEACGILKD